MSATKNPADPLDPSRLDDSEEEEGGGATQAMTALPFQDMHAQDMDDVESAEDEVQFGNASTIDIKGGDVEAWLKKAEATDAPGRGGEFRTLVESPAVMSVPKAAAVQQQRMSRPTHPTIAEAPPVSVPAAPSVQAKQSPMEEQQKQQPPPAGSSLTVADMQAFNPPKRPPPPSGMPPWTIAVIAVLALAIIAVVLVLVGVF